MEKEKEESPEVLEFKDMSSLTAAVQESNNLVKNFGARMDALEGYIRDGKIPALTDGGARADIERNKELNNGFRFILNKNRNNSDKPDVIKNSFLGEGQGTDVSDYVVPPEIYKQIISLSQKAGILLRDAMIIPMTTKELIIPKATSFPTFAFKNEGARPSISNPGFDKITLLRQDGGFVIVLSRNLIEDSSFDLVGFCTMLAGMVFPRVVDQVGFNGITPIKGLSHADYVLDEEIFDNGFTKFTDTAYDDILKLVGGLDDVNNISPKFYMHRSIYYNVIRTLKAEGSKEYVVNPIDVRDRMLESYNCELPLDMPKTTDSLENQKGKRFIYFADFKQNVMLGMRHSFGLSYSDSASIGSGETIINLWEQGLVGLKFEASFDVKFPFPEKIRCLKTASV